MVPYNTAMPVQFISTAMAIKRFFDGPTARYPWKKLDIAELRRLTERDLVELAPMCAEALGCELYPGSLDHVSSPT